MASLCDNPSTTTDPQEAGFYIQLLLNGVPLDFAMLIGKHDAKSPCTMTVTGVKILNLQKNDVIGMRLVSNRKKKYVIAAGDARIAISQKRWW